MLRRTPQRLGRRIRAANSDWTLKLVMLLDNYDFEKRLTAQLVGYVSMPPIQVEPPSWINSVSRRNTSKEAKSRAKDQHDDPKHPKTEDELVKNFIAKGDTASFVKDIIIEDLGGLIENLCEEFNLKYPHEIPECNASKITIIYLWMFPIRSQVVGLFGDGNFELTIGDLKEAVTLGHWHCKYAYYGDEKIHASIKFNVMSIVMLAMLYVVIAKWLFETFP